MLLFCRTGRLSKDTGGTRQKDLPAVEAAGNSEDVGKSSEKWPGLVSEFSWETTCGEGTQEPRAGCRNKDKLER